MLFILINNCVRSSSEANWTGAIRMEGGRRRGFDELGVGIGGGSGDGVGSGVRIAWAHCGAEHAVQVKSD